LKGSAFKVPPSLKLLYNHPSKYTKWEKLRGFETEWILFRQPKFLYSRSPFVANIIVLGAIIIFTWTINLNLPNASLANFAIPFLVVDLKLVKGVKIPRKITYE
jgi:hypothetical protein